MKSVPHGISWKTLLRFVLQENLNIFSVDDVLGADPARDRVNIGEGIRRLVAVRVLKVVGGPPLKTYQFTKKGYSLSSVNDVRTVKNQPAFQLARENAIRGMRNMTPRRHVVPGDKNSWEDFRLFPTLVIFSFFAEWAIRNQVEVLKKETFPEEVLKILGYASRASLVLLIKRLSSNRLVFFYQKEGKEFRFRQDFIEEAGRRNLLGDHPNNPFLEGITPLSKETTF